VTLRRQGVRAGPERSVTHGRERRGSGEEEAGPGHRREAAAVTRSARARPPRGAPTESGPALCGGRLPRRAGRPRSRHRPEHAGQVDSDLSHAGRGGPGGEAAAAADPAAAGGARGQAAGRRAEAAPPRLRDPEDQPVPPADVPAAGEPGDGAPRAARARTAPEAHSQAPAPPRRAALLRARHAQPALADRHLHLPPGRQERLPDRLSRRSFPLRGGARRLPQPDGGARAGGLPPGRRGVRGAQGAAHRPGPAVLELAGHDPLRSRAQEGPRAPPEEPAPPPHDARQDRALLENDLGGVPRPRPVRELRVGR